MKFTAAGRRSARRAVAVALALSAAGLLAPAASQAGTLRIEEEFACDEDVGCFIQGRPQYFEGELAERNTVTLTRVSETRIVLRDETAEVEVGERCTSISANEARCDMDNNPSSFPEFITGYIALGGLDDSITLQGVPVDMEGGDGDDTLNGDAAANLIGGGPGVDALDGGAGNDTLDGGTGSDLLLGGDDADTVTYASRGTGEHVAIRLDGLRNDGADPNQSGVSSSAEEGDRDQAIEYAVGGGGADRLLGGDGPNRLFGGEGNDRFDGGLASDLLDGGNGTDTITYTGRAADQPVAVRLDGVANDGADPNRNGTSTSLEEADRDLSIENAIGGSGHDRLVGNAAVNTLAGSFGADTLDGGFGGDLLDGGSGSDLVTYTSRTERVTIRLDGLRNDGRDPNLNGLSNADEEGDRDIAIENAFGGAGNDAIRSVLTGRNILAGYGGNDRIFSRDGSSTQDILQCGAGSDATQTDPSDQRNSCESVIP